VPARPHPQDAHQRRAGHPRERQRPGGLFDDQLDRGKAQAAFGIVTVPHTHELRAILAKQFFGALLASTSVRLARMVRRPARREARLEDDTDSCS
jgi:hypothetical protein